MPRKPRNLKYIKMGCFCLCVMKFRNLMEKVDRKKKIVKQEGKKPNSVKEIEYMSQGIQKMLDQILTGNSKKIKMLNSYLIERQAHITVNTQKEQSEEYKYFLKPVQAIPQYFIKEKNIELQFILVNKQGRLVCNQNRLFMEVSLKMVSNRTGSVIQQPRIISYSPESSVIHGKGTLLRVKMHQLSIKNDTMKLIINLECSRKKNKELNWIFPHEVEPLVIDNFMVKSKTFRLNVDEQH